MRPAVLGVLFCAMAATASGQSATPIPVFLTVSGGISKGSHQGGVNWGLMRILRLSGDSSFREAHAIAGAGLTLGGMTGASAGNINAVLTALEWCRADDEPDPRRSLFWRIWVPTGFTNMLGTRDIQAGASDSGGLFDRAYFRRAHLATLREFSDGRTTRLRECRVPVGITVTKTSAERTEVFPGLEVPVTRFASTFEVSRDAAVSPSGDRGLQFRDFARNGQIAHFGERIWLAAPESAGLTVETMFALVSASSAFPVAFGPQLLRYFRDPACREGLCPDTSALFLDGGVFDNNPVDLTIGIRRAVASRGRSITVYIDPDGARAPPPEAFVADTARGLSGLFPLAGGLVAAGRAYELYALAKALDLDSTSYDLANNPIVATDRHFAIVGAEFGAFGAFLGRPFRVFDFHVGIYDALVFAARELVPYSRGDTLPTDSLATRVLAFVEDDSLIAFARDREILRQLWTEEFASPVLSVAAHGRSRPASAAADTLESRVMAALLRGSVAATKSGAASDCRAVGPLGTVYCRGKLPFFVRAVAEHDRDLVTGSGFLPPRTVDDSAALDAWNDSLFVDEDFARLIASPQQRLYVLANRLVARMYYNEKKIGAGQWVVGISFAGLLLNQAYLAEQREQIFFSDIWGTFDPSTIPRSISGWKCLRCWVPYRVTGMVGVSGGEVDYRPTWRARPGLGLYATLTPYAWHIPQRGPEFEPNYTPGGRPPPRAYWSVGVGVLRQFNAISVSSLEIGWRAYRPFRSGPPWKNPRNDVVAGLDISGQFLAGRIQAGVRIFPDNSGLALNRTSRRWGGPTTLNAGIPVVFALSIPDVPGLLYWFLPR